MKTPSWERSSNTVSIRRGIRRASSSRLDIGYRVRGASGDVDVASSAATTWGDDRVQLSSLG
jgi:hypothetical protein